MPEIYAVGGGKGGTGKSVFSTLLGRAFAEEEMSTVLIDGDLGGANLHSLLGMNYPRVSLVDFLMRRVKSLDDLMLLTSNRNVRLVSGAGEVLGMANLKATVKAKLIRHIRSLDVERVVLDLGAGSSFNVLDLFLSVDKHVVVVSPEPTSLQNVYEFLKFSVGRLLHTRFSRLEVLTPFIRRFNVPDQEKGLSTVPELLDAVAPVSRRLAGEIKSVVNNFRPYVVANMVESAAEAGKYYSAIESTSMRYLMVKTVFAGSIFRSRELVDAIKRRESLLSMKLGMNNYPLMKIRSALRSRPGELPAVSGH